MTERVAIYVDGSNVYFAQKESLGWWIDWPRFLDATGEDRELVSVCFLSLGVTALSAALALIAIERAGEIVYVASDKTGREVQLRSEASCQVDRALPLLCRRGDVDGMPLPDALHVLHLAHLLLTRLEGERQ